MDRSGAIELSPIAVPNYYEDRGETKTEGAYETLQFNNPAERKARTATGRWGDAYRSCGRRTMCLLLLAVNAGLLGSVLIIVSLHYSHTARGLPSSAASQHDCQSRDECWLLHHEKLYYISTQKGSCGFASHFCAQRQSVLAAVRQGGEGFLASRTGSQSFWVEPSGGEEDTDLKFESSGDNLEDIFSIDEEWDLMFSDQSCPCALLSEGGVRSAQHCQEEFNWICQRA
ncbi:natural killer cells antigen CD94 isoform X1 [Acipenser oxyrinchus oxyrinchus]|uniref:Natural killer cells antigen CD94 isoform X1 n=1 Tax=Acipenser oxyrinchus oxyrinchus TaxID=40147 RepID=A0AAD8FS23_ACIOX|nr:natural killer cells antigen CD94 isoform X1 [Acipenser oxyrinchus oxyrinchus]